MQVSTELQAGILKLWVANYELDLEMQFIKKFAWSSYITATWFKPLGITEN